MYGCIKRMDAVVTLLVEMGADVNVATEDGETALYYALKARRSRVVRVLFTRGARFNLQEPKSKVLLRDAVKDNDLEFFECLLENGVELYPHLLVELMILAARFNADRVIAMCINRGTSVNCTDDRNRTPLHEAAEHGHESVVRLLVVTYKARINAVDVDGQTPIMLAAKHYHTGCAVVFLQNGATADFTHPIFKTLLVTAAEKVQLVCAGLLVERGVPVTWEVTALIEENVEERGIQTLDDKEENMAVVDHFYEVVLLKAAEMGRTRGVEMLISNGVDVTYASPKGDTPLHLAAANGHTAVVDCILSHGGVMDKTDALDEKGLTPLHRAAMNGHVGVVRLLVERGAANVACKDSAKQRTALGWAVLHKYSGCVKYLCTKGCDALIPDGENFTPYDWALVADAVDRLWQTYSIKIGRITAADAAAASGTRGVGRELLDALISLDDVRKKRRNFALKTVWKTSALYLFWIVLLTTVASLSTTQNKETAFYVTESLRDLFINRAFVVPSAVSTKDSHNSSSSDSHGELHAAFQNLHNRGDFWTYMEGPLVDHLYVEELYHDVPLHDDEKGFVYFHHRLLGLVRIRQMRVRDDSCSIAPEFSTILNRCYAELSPSTEDRRTFGSGPEFVYRSAQDLEIITIPGIPHTKFTGGGFVADLPTNRTLAKQAVAKLKEEQWVDWSTAAVVIDFTLYNANVDLSVVARIVFAFPPSGGVDPSFSCTVLRLFKKFEVLDAIIILLEVLTVIIGVYYILLDMWHIRQQKLAYFFQLSSYYGLLMHALFITVIVYRCCQLVLILVTIDWSPQDTRFIDMTYPAEIEQQLKDLMAILLALAWLQTLKFMRIFPICGPIVQAVFNTFVSPPVLTFAAVFVIIIVSFSLGFHVAFGSSVAIFRTFEYSMMTLFRVTFGDFAHDMEALQQANPVLGPFLFTIYIVIATLILINLFIAIFAESYRIAQGMRVAHWNDHISELMEKEPRILLLAKSAFENEKLLERRWYAFHRRQKLQQEQAVLEALELLDQPAAQGGDQQQTLKSALSSRLKPSSAASTTSTQNNDIPPSKAPSVLSVASVNRRASFDPTIEKGSSAKSAVHPQPAATLSSGGGATSLKPLSTSSSSLTVAPQGSARKQSMGTRLLDRMHSSRAALSARLAGPGSMSNRNGGTKLTEEELADLRSLPPEYFAPGSENMRILLRLIPPKDRARFGLDDPSLVSHTMAVVGNGTRNSTNLVTTGADSSGVDSEGALMSRAIADVEMNLLSLKVALERSLGDQGEQVNDMKRNLESLAMLQNDRISFVGDKLEAMASTQKRQLVGLQNVLDGIAAHTDKQAGGGNGPSLARR